MFTHIQSFSEDKCRIIPHSQEYSVLKGYNFQLCLILIISTIQCIIQRKQCFLFPEQHPEYSILVVSVYINFFSAHLQTPFAYECCAQETAAPKTTEFSCESKRQCRITVAGADRILYFQSLFKERKLSAYSHYKSRQTGDQSYSFVSRQVCENLTGNRGYKNNINRRNLVHITNFQ